MGDNDREANLHGRYWPTDSMRPGETVSQWTRRMNSYTNPPEGTSELREEPGDGEEGNQGNNRSRARNALKVPRDALRRWLSVS